MVFFCYGVDAYICTYLMSAVLAFFLQGTPYDHRHTYGAPVCAPLLLPPMCIVRSARTTSLGHLIWARSRPSTFHSAEHIPSSRAFLAAALRAKKAKKAKKGKRARTGKRRSPLSIRPQLLTGKCSDDDRREKGGAVLHGDCQRELCRKKHCEEMIKPSTRGRSGGPGLPCGNPVRSRNLVEDESVEMCDSCAVQDSTVQLVARSRPSTHFSAFSGLQEALPGHCD